MEIWGKHLVLTAEEKGRKETEEEKAGASKLDPMISGSLYPIPQAQLSRPTFLKHCLHWAVVLLNAFNSMQNLLYS